MLKVTFTKQMIKAFIYLVFLSVNMSLLDYINIDISITKKIAQFIFQIINSAYTILILDLLCRSKVKLEDIELEITNFSTWGYFWRGYISFYMFIPLWILIVNILPLNLPHRSEYTAITFLQVEPLYLLCVTMAVWACFSKNRISQLKYILSLIRGF